MLRLRRRLLAALFPAAVVVSGGCGGIAPTLSDSPTSAELVEALQARHKAPKTVTFTQRAVTFDADGGEVVQIMDEWLSVPGWLRIDLSQPEPTSVVFHPEGRTLLTAEARRDRDTGSTVMLLMLDVFGQDSATWLARSGQVGLDHAVVSRQEWEGDPAWVLGAEPGQLDRTQLWLDASTLFPVRYLEPQLGRSGATSLIEGRAYDYEHFGGVPFHTRFEFYRDGELFMTEVYENVVIDEELPEGIFDPEAIARQLAGDVAS